MRKESKVMNPEGFALLSYILSDHFEPKLGESHDLFRGGEKEINFKFLFFNLLLSQLLTKRRLRKFQTYLEIIFCLLPDFSKRITSSRVVAPSS